MAGLILNLRPWETFLVGDVVLQNGGRRAQIRVRDEKAGVLRLSDALHPDGVKTPLTRAYYAAQLLVLGQAQEQQDMELLLKLLEEVAAAFGDQSDALREARGLAREGQYYKVLKLLKPLLPDEVMLLSRDVQALEHIQKS
ncbi:MAG: flagellar biosynthesis repressor FlbT [Pseudomonadota bacterium]